MALGFTGRLKPPLLSVKAAWRDFVRGHTVGQRRRLGFFGRFPFLLMMRCAIFCAVLIRIDLDIRSRRNAIGVLVTMGVMAILAIPLTYKHREGKYDLVVWAFIFGDVVLITYLVVWAHAPQSDVFLLYTLPLLTAAEYLGGWTTVATFAMVSVAYGLAILGPSTPAAVRLAIFATREVYLLFIVLLSLCVFQVTSAWLGDFHAALRKINEENRSAIDVDSELDDFMRRVLELGFEFVAISTVDPYQKLIVMTRAINIPAGWMRLSRRGTESNDIMAHVVKYKVPESPPPDDKRFDEKTWRVFKHGLLARTFVPVIYEDQAVAVLQTGWERVHKGDIIPQALVAELCRVAAEYAKATAVSSPHALLERLCQIVMDAVKPCAAVTLHICQESVQPAAARAGTYSASDVMSMADPGGPVTRLLALDGPVWLETPELVEREYPALYEAGCRSVAAMPLAIDPETRGLLLVHFEDEQRFGNWLKEQIRLLARGVESSIHNRLLLNRFARQSSSAWMQSRLKTVEDAVAFNAPLPVVLERVADHFLYNLEADLVTLYELQPGRRDFRVPPVIAGDLVDPNAMKGSIQLGNLLWNCLAKPSSFFTELPREFRSGWQDGPDGKRFADREGVQSCAVLVLQTEDSREKTGLLFVNYRRRFEFSPEDRVAMLTLASSAAVVIRTAHAVIRRRDTVQAMREIEKAIAATGGPPDLDLVFRHVLAATARLTGASEGWVLWFDPGREYLEWRASLDGTLPEPRVAKPEDLGLAGEVAIGKRLRLATDPKEGNWMAVPVLDGLDALGVVLMRSNSRPLLTEEDATTVEMLSVLAVAGARFAQLYSPLESLSAVAARLQEKPFDLDTALRIILTGVTAQEGLGFSRAMVFLQAPNAADATGRLAVGPLNGTEARNTWKFIESRKRELRAGGRSVFTWLLDEAERISSEIRGGARRDSELSQHVQTVTLPSSLARTPLGGYSTSECKALLSRGEWLGQFACVPLMVEDNCRGVLIADRDFQGKGMSESDAPLLQLFANIAAIAVESLTVRTPTSESERLEQWSHLFSEARHEVGTRLTLLDGFVEEYRRGIVKTLDLDSFLLAVRHRIARANWMAKKIQPWQAEPVALVETVDLVEMMEGAVLDTRFIFPRATIELDKRVPDSSQLWLVCDPLEMEGAFLELLRNAGEALGRIDPPGGTVTVRIGVEGDGPVARASIQVQDNGVGIPMAMRERVFDPQYTTKEGGYHGYGLVGAKRRIESVGGSIKVVGPEGRGANIEISLPIRMERARTIGA